MTDRKRITESNSNVEMNDYNPNYDNVLKSVKKKPVYKSKIFILAVSFSTLLLLVMTAGFIVHHTINSKHPINGVLETRALTLEMPYEQQEWYDRGTLELQKALHRERNTRRAKNVILFIGDGMGPNTVTAARIMAFSEEGLMSWEEFPDMGLLKVSRIALDSLKKRNRFSNYIFFHPLP